MSMELKSKALEKLKEESSSVRQYALLFLIIQMVCMMFYAAVLLAGVVVAVSCTNGGLEDPPTLLQKMAVSLVKFQQEAQASLMNEGENFHLLRFSVRPAGELLTCGIYAYVSWRFYQAFCAISAGETPFTKESIRAWRSCCRLFTGITVAFFLLSFLLRGVFLLSVVPPMMAACFFGALQFIFEYGSCLQVESDETL